MDITLKVTSRSRPASWDYDVIRHALDGQNPLAHEFVKKVERWWVAAKSPTVQFEHILGGLDESADIFEKHPNCTASSPVAEYSKERRQLIAARACLSRRNVGQAPERQAVIDAAKFALVHTAKVPVFKSYGLEFALPLKLALQQIVNQWRIAVRIDVVQRAT